MASYRPFDAIPEAVRNSVLVVALVLTAISWWTFAGPYAWLSTLQIAVTGSYVPVLSGLFTALGLTVLALLPIRVLYVGRSAAPSTGEPLWLTRLQTRRARAALLGVGLLGFALWGVGTGWSAGPLTDVALADLVAGRAPSRWIRVPLVGLAPEHASMISGDYVDWYLPIVLPDRPVAVFVTVRTSHEDDDPLAELGDGSGLVLATGLPPELRAYIDLPIAAQTWVIDLEDSPEHRIHVGIIMGVIGLVALLAAALGHLWVALRAR